MAGSWLCSEISLDVFTLKTKLCGSSGGDVGVGEKDESIVAGRCVERKPMIPLAPTIITSSMLTSAVFDQREFVEAVAGDPGRVV